MDKEELTLDEQYAYHGAEVARHREAQRAIDAARNAITQGEREAQLQKHREVVAKSIAPEDYKVREVEDVDAMGVMDEKK